MTTLQGRLIPISDIEIPDEYERKDSIVEDDALRKSIEASGIQQPLIVFSKGKGKYVLIKGGRRLQIADFIGLKSVPCVVDSIPEGSDPNVYRNRMRFILDEHRQDLFPSQRSALIKQLMAMFKMKQKDVAAYLGVDAGSITNWLAVDNYIPPIVKALDSGEITQFAARSFDGMTPDGQAAVWKSHRSDLAKLPAGRMHKVVREKYHPEKHPEFYIAPEKTAEKLTRTRTKRASKARPKLSANEKRLLVNDLGLRETELKDSQAELAQLKKEITLATPPIRAILRSEDLMAMLPDEVKVEFERFGEVYC